MSGYPFSDGPEFNGSDYEPQFDKKRLSGQLLRVYTLMADGKWRTLSEIADSTGDPAGSYEVQKRSRFRRSVGLFEYRLKI
jgi:hypothetical protein